MKLPPLTAHHAIGAPVGRYSTAPSDPPTPGVQPMATISCLTSCVGSAAARRCATQCGGDLDCWRSCAGVSDTGCVAACLTT